MRRGGELYFQDWMWCDDFDGVVASCTYVATLGAGEYTYQFAVTNRYGTTVSFPDPPGSGPTVA